MKYKRLGNTGLNVSRLCLGTMTFGWSADEATSFSIMDAAYDAGVTFFDTADIYSGWVSGNKGGESETVIGKWLKTKDRRRVIIATKVRGRMWEGENGDGLSRHHIMHAVEDSLRRLDTDYIDLYQTHWFDANTPIEETLRAMDDLITSGKVRYIGASNYPAWRLTKSLWASDVNRLCRYESLQPHYSLFNRAEFERELADLCVDQNIGVIPYSPLAAGFLTGKYTRDDKSGGDTTRGSGGLIQRLINDAHAFEVLDIAQGIAENHNVPVAHVALAWMLAKPAITSPIIGARTLAQFEQVVGAVDLELSDDEIAQLDEATKGY
jgi:aryl-alcohol dehydrogenase-like predicted oxidoreductase